MTQRHSPDRPPCRLRFLRVHHDAEVHLARAFDQASVVNLGGDISDGDIVNGADDEAGAFNRRQVAGAVMLVSAQAIHP